MAINRERQLLAAESWVMLTSQTFLKDVLLKLLAVYFHMEMEGQSECIT